MKENYSSNLPPDKPTWQLRALTPSDASAYLEVRLRALREDPPAFGPLPGDEPNIAETAARLTATEDRCFFGTFAEGQLVGIIRVARYSAANEKHRAYLAGLYVLPQFRRNGCASALVKQALEWAQRAGNIRRVNLTVVSGQSAAIALYHQFGFTIYGTERETFSRDGRFFDEHLMTLELTTASR